MLFDERINLKPYEYPEILEFVEAIRKSYWVHTEFNFTSDIQDFKVNTSEEEREAIERTMLAIAQIEVSVKTFWGDVYRHIQKPEIGSVGFTFAESEVRHMDAYSHLLEILGLNSKFQEIKNIPAIIDRISYLKKISELSKTRDNKKYTQAILLFSVFVEHISLFSQFLIIMSFNKYKNIFKGISNVVEATSKEEQIHGMFWVTLINIIKKEYPELLDEEMQGEINSLCIKAMKAEEKILDYIFEKGELIFLPKEEIINFIRQRFNSSLNALGMLPLFEVNETLSENTEWFYDEIMATKHWDFFVKRSVNYNKKWQSITEDDLF